MTTEREQGTQRVGDVVLEGQDGDSVSVYRLSFPESEADASALLSEAIHLQRLRHPNVARVREMRVRDQSAELAVDRLHGLPLSAYVSERTPDLAEIRSLAVQLTSALEYLRAAGLSGPLRLEHVVVHDAALKVSGSNLVTHPWITWQGLVQSPLTPVLSRRNSGANAEWDDVFALGVVLYHMLTRVGAGMLDHTSIPAILAFEYFIRSELPPSSLKHGIPPEWDSVVVGAVAQARRCRFDSLAELRASIADLPLPDGESVAFHAAGVADRGLGDFAPDDRSGVPEAALDLSGPFGKSVRGPLSGMAVALVVLAAVMYGIAWTSLHGRVGIVRAAPLLPVSGLRLGGEPLLSGGNVVLVWHRVAGASRYEVRLASQLQHRAVFVTTGNTSYTILRPLGVQTFVWRVAALVDGRWTPFSTTSTFTVAAPRVAVPFLLAPSSRSAVHRGNVRFCWQPVPGVRQYRLRIRTTQIHVSRSCVLRHLTPGHYVWSVQALAQGVQLYAGDWAPLRALTVLAPTLPPPATATPSAAATAVIPRPIPATAPQIQAAPTFGPMAAPTALRPPPVRRSAPSALVPTSPPAPTRVPVVPTAVPGPTQAPPAIPTVSLPSGDTNVACDPAVNC